ncbi:DUF1178 family protein [Nitratireductor thuwali]|uniref:DUF1178 family protein n=1 Tax=Nitratireductor thuwali TaxID=2267699 RepID=A0ABY5MKC2_9HYPH|nr:hypothetical protein NTH_01570 [Nitratireductor thuwali]
MIRFDLACAQDHSFDAWFRNGADFDAQNEKGLIACPHCGSNDVRKALMAPAVSTSRKKSQVALAMGDEQKKALAKLKALSEKVRENADYVGDKFAEEARKIHFGETDPRGIYGEATSEDVKGLVDDGVDFLPLPVFPEDRN